MTPPVLVDTGPLVALLSEHDRYHAWAKEADARAEPPLLTCEAVLSEAWYLLRSTRRGQAALLELVERSLVSIDFALKGELTAVRRQGGRGKGCDLSRPLHLQPGDAFLGIRGFWSRPQRN